MSNFDPNRTNTLSDVVKALSSRVGNLQRVGGRKRFYNVGGDDAAAYIVDGSSFGIGLAWRKGSKHISTIYFWRRFSANREPDYAIDLPEKGSIDLYIDNVVSLLRNPRVGTIEVSAGPISEDASLTKRDSSLANDTEFLNMAREMFGSGINNLTFGDLQAVADEHGVTVPQHIRFDQSIKTGDRYDLTKLVHRAAMANQGTPVNQSVPKDAGFDDLVKIARAKEVKNLAGSGKIVLYGRAPDGTMFEIPGLEEFSSQIERMLVQQLGHGDETEMSMEEQYELVRERTKLILSGRSNFVKSLLVLGAPSSGKTYNIMETVKEMGLQEGKDYVSKKGKITPSAMYRTLIEQIDGLCIFDDCDSVMEDKNGVNMLKGALDTDPIREVSNDSRGTINTGAMSREKRVETVDSISRIFRGVPTPEDMNRFAYMLDKNKKIKGKIAKEKPSKRFKDFEMDDDESRYDYMDATRYNLDAVIGDEYVPDESDLDELQSKLMNRLPNKIEYRGRIIFISNMKKDEWNSAILTRAFYVNMNFTSGEMLDYIERIQKNIKTPTLTDGQKQEVIDWVRELYTTGKFKTQINFRIIQQAFDLRLTSNWKRMVALI